MDRYIEVPIRILVTGSRGKSSVVRMLCSALVSCGLNTRGRITGVLPRELSACENSPPSVVGEKSERCVPGPRSFKEFEFRRSFYLKETLLLRSGPASVGEMRWWLSTLPSVTDAVVMENSAVAPDLQALAFRWLRPNCTVLTNVRPDHEDAWGRGEEKAILTLCSDIAGDKPPFTSGHPVVLPRTVAGKPLVRELLMENGCEIYPCDEGVKYEETHLALVGAICRIFGLDPQKGCAAAGLLTPDVADFGLFPEGEGVLAAAFSANDLESTELLFCSTGWSREETTLLFNSRHDRVGRFKAFLPWLHSSLWRKVCITGSRPLFLPSPIRFSSIPDVHALQGFVNDEGKVFGCGNVAGVPLEYLASKRLGDTGRGGTS